MDRRDTREYVRSVLASLPPIVRTHLPPLVLAMAALSSLSTGLQLLRAFPDLPWLGLSFFGAGALQGVGAWGLHAGRFWARGYAVGALIASGIGIGLWLTPFGISISASLLAVLILLADDAPGRYERRTAFLAQAKLDARGARRLFFVALGLGAGLQALLGSPLSIVLMLSAPLPTMLAAILAVAGFVGLTRLASWCYVALAGAVVSLAVAVVMSALAGREGHALVWGSLSAALFLAAMLPLTGPVMRHLRGGRPEP